jgi:penicillin-binding protein 1C
MKKISKLDRLFLILVFVLSFFYPLSQQELSFEESASLKIYDRNGFLLREVLSLQQGKGHWTPFEAINPRAVQAAVSAEDKRFYDHPGIDPLAMTRAAWQNISSGEVISGGSTITQQVIRNLYHFPRNIFFKILEIWYAIRLEYTLSKQEILEQYFNRIPFGNQTFGIEAAARMYLGKGANDLSWAEASFLTALPKSPTHYNPYKNFQDAKKRQSFILRKLFESGKITPDELDRARNEPLILFPKTNAFYAPHFCDHILQSELPKSGSLQTTLDLALQTEIETIIKGHVGNLQAENVTNAAVIVISNKTGDILAMAGSSGYFDEHHDGQYNGVFAKRQPGSALKPFTYAAAFNKNMTTASIIPDIETVIPSEKAMFTPHNYDNRFHGPVRARIALACSYNISAVRVLQSVGVESLLSLLHACGIGSLKEGPEYYGHGLTLGNGEVTLFELTRAYSILANSGQWIEPRFHFNQPVQSVRENIISPQISFLITDILSDNRARVPAFGYDSSLELPFPCAVKTGTSSDFRDNMTIGYTSDYTVGVWVGNFDNSPMREISGVTGAGPIFHDIMMLLHRNSNTGDFHTPPKIRSEAVCSFSGALPHRGCINLTDEYFVEGTEPKNLCSFHLNNGAINTSALMPEYSKWLEDASNGNFARHENMPAKNVFSQAPLKIIHPRDNAVFKIDPNVKLSYQSIYFEALAPDQTNEINWYLNDRLYQSSLHPFKVQWNLSPGKHRLRAEGKAGDKIFRDEIRMEVLP